MAECPLEDLLAMIRNDLVTRAVSHVLQQSKRQEDLRKLGGTFVDGGILPQFENRNSQILYGRDNVPNFVELTDFRGGVLVIELLLVIVQTVGAGPLVERWDAETRSRRGPSVWFEFLANGTCGERIGILVGGTWKLDGEGIEKVVT
jgi:hypothetical protein